MSLEKDPIFKTIYRDLKRGIELTMEQGHHVSAAILLFSSIDILANLDRPEGKVEGESGDFFRWVERYLLRFLPAGIPGEEVYSARCAVVHTAGSESRRTRDGSVRKVAFMVGGNLAIAYNPQIDRALIVINLDLLVKAFFSAIDTFLVDAFADPKRAAVIGRRLGQMLTSMSYKPEQTPPAGRTART